MGTPVVTLPGEFLRSRITRALYAKMAGSKLDDSPAPIAQSASDYVETAVRVANEGDAVCDWIVERASALFADAREVDDLAAWLSEV